MFGRLLLLVFGALELLFTRQFVDRWMAAITHDDIEIRPWVYRFARIEGLVIVLAVLHSMKCGKHCPLKKCGLKSCPCRSCGRR